VQPDKLPPFNVDAENAVCGSVLIDGRVIHEIADVLSPADFYTDPAQKIYAVALELKRREVPIDQITVAQELEQQDQLVKVGGAAFLQHLLSVVPTSMDALHYANIVHRLGIHRKLITVGAQIQKIGYQADPDLDSSLAQADELVIALRKAGGSQEIITPDDRASLLYDRYERLSALDNQIAVPTGFLDLDHELGGGLFGGQLIVLGADSGLGKSTLAQNIAVNQSNFGNVLFCSGEMSVESLSDKEIAALTGRDVLEIVSGKYSEDLLARIQGAIGTISQRKVYYFEPRAFTLPAIHQAMEAMAARHGLKSVVVDYLSIIETPNQNSRYQELGEISKTLKAFAREYDVPVILLCQLSRSLESRDNKRPQKSDLYESKRPEQDADVILLLHRVDKYYTREDWEANYQNYGDSMGWTHVYTDGVYPEGIAEIIIDKQRIGGTGKRRIIKILWDQSRQRYQNLEFARA
jgi:replicative DNA helicase